MLTVWLVGESDALTYGPTLIDTGIMSISRPEVLSSILMLTSWIEYASASGSVVTLSSNHVDADSLAMDN